MRCHCCAVCCYSLMACVALNQQGGKRFRLRLALFWCHNTSYVAVASLVITDKAQSTLVSLVCSLRIPLRVFKDLEHRDGPQTSHCSSSPPTRAFIRRSEPDLHSPSPPSLRRHRLELSRPIPHVKHLLHTSTTLTKVHLETNLRSPQYLPFDGHACLNFRRSSYHFNESRP